MPVLGLCFGLQSIVIEYARNVAYAEHATSEFDPSARKPRCHRWKSSANSLRVPGIWGIRLGLPGSAEARFPLLPGRTEAKTCRNAPRHRYEVNVAYKQ